MRFVGVEELRNNAPAAMRRFLSLDSLIGCETSGILA